MDNPIIQDIKKRILAEHKKYAHEKDMDWALYAAAKIYDSWLKKEVPTHIHAERGKVFDKIKNTNKFPF